MCSRCSGPPATTTLFVTHDQDEALASAEQVAVLAGGRIAQAAPPKVLYARPATPEIARFLGAANLIEGTFEGSGVRTALGVPGPRRRSGRRRPGPGPRPARAARRRPGGPGG